MSDGYGIESSIPAFKIIVIGDVGVGKTSLIRRYVDNDFADHYSSSLGVDFKTKEYETKDGTTVKLQLWDFQSLNDNRFATVAKHSYTEAHGIVIVFDITNKDSFEDLETHWLTEIQNQALRPNVCKILVGNKTDLEKRVIEEGKAKSYGSKYGCDYIETSAKKGVNVSEMFSKIGETVYNSWKQKEGNSNEPTLWTDQTEKKKKCNIQ
ncbi:hypothetical protein ABK040_006359 [Willaertia magna]